MRLSDRLDEGRRRLVEAGIEPSEASIDVDLFARAILGWDRVRLLVARPDPPPGDLEPRFSEWIERRVGREPSAYIVGVKEFWGLDFRVTPAVLIPRPETEFIVEEALQVLRSTGQDAPRLADLGTGCGCLAVSLAHELPGATVTATDISEDALAVARDNAARHGVDRRVRFVHTSFLDGIDGPFDLIAANPPYVKEGDRAGLGPSVRFEPEVALFGGATGLRGIEEVLDAAVRTLRSGGTLVMEFGLGQDDDVRRLAAARPALRLVRIREDLQRIPRTAIMERP